MVKPNVKHKQTWLIILWFMLLILSFGIRPSFSLASFTITLKLDRKDATLSDSVKLTLVVEGIQGQITPRIPGLQNFRVERGGSSSFFNMINGQVSRGINQEFFLMPQREGTFVIGPAMVDIQGKNYQSNQVTLTVKKVAEDSNVQDATQPVFMTASLSQPSAYPGEIVYYTLKFYYSISVRDLSVSPPEIDGLKFKQLGDHTEYTSRVKGKQFQVIELKYSVTPEQNGQFTIPPSTMRMNVLEKRRGSGFGFFNDDFFGLTTARPHSVGTNSLPFETKSLPDEGRPQDFSGLVGQFELQATVTPDHVKCGESSTFSIIIQGKGNVTVIPDIKLPEISNVKSYADQPDLKVKETHDGVSGIKTMKWALVPQNDGSITIPEIQLSYFNPQKETYEIAKSKPLHIEVLECEKKEQLITFTSQSDDALKPFKKEVKMFNRDILPIHHPPDAIEPIKFQQLHPLHMGFLIFTPPFLFLCILFLNHMKRFQKLDVIASKKAASKLYRELREIDFSSDMPEVLKALNNYFNERMRLSGGNLTPDDIEKELQNRKVSEENSSDMKKLLMTLEASVYAGMQGKQPEDIKHSLIKRIKHIEKEIKV